MCFSAGASFAGGVVISAIGVVTIREVHKPSQIVFACIPVFFGIQQIVEGCLWIALPDADYHVDHRDIFYTVSHFGLVLFCCTHKWCNLLDTEGLKKRIYFQKAIFIKNKF